jgi:protein ImuB
MVIAVVIPRFPLLVALLAAKTPRDRPVALGPQPGDPQVVGLCTGAAQKHGVIPGLRVGEALSRCPELQLVPPDPEGVAKASEKLLERLEAMGAAVEPVEVGVACFESRGLERLHGGLDRLLKRLPAALPVGAGGRIGVAPSRFAALQAGREAKTRAPLMLQKREVAHFLSPLPIGRLASALGRDGDADAESTPDDPLDAKTVAMLESLGIRTLGQMAMLPRRAVLDRLGFPGVRAWRLARGEDGRRLRPRTPPDPIESSVTFPEPVGALPALQSAAKMLIYQITAIAAARGRAIRRVGFRAQLIADASWSRSLTLREPSTDPERIASAALPNLGTIAAPVLELTVRADADTAASGRQITLADTGPDERRRRTGEALRHVQSAYGDEALLRAIEVEPHTRLPERRWVLAPFDI